MTQRAERATATGFLAVLWDLDGTLLDPNGSIRATVDRVLTENGLQPFDPETRRLIGRPLRDIFALRTRDPDHIEAMVHRYREVFADTAWRRVRPVPGILDLVDALRERGILQAVVTTKGETEADQLLRRIGWRDRFATVVGDDDVRAVKPHPEPVLEACRRLGVAPRDAIMVGDTSYDVEAGNAAGCHTVGVLWGHGDADVLRAAGAHEVVPDIAGLTALLQARP